MTEVNRFPTVAERTDATPRGVAGTGAAGGRNGRPSSRSGRPAGRIRERNDHDAATVLAVVLALSGGHEARQLTSTGPQSVWSDPAYRLGARHPSPVAWWASAMPR